MEVHSGILTIKAPSLLKTKLYNNYWCILFTGRSRLSPRIDFYEDKAQVGLLPCKKTIYLEEAKWVKTDSLDPAFSFEVKHNKQYIFVTASRSEVSLWILILCCVSKDLFDTKLIIGIEELNKMDSYFTEDGEEIVVTENILYSSSNDMSTFIVVADQTDSCIQHGLKGLYKLCVKNTILQLLQYDSEKEVASWSLLILKKFGHSLHTFFIEVGTRSATGAGKFVFQTTEGAKITESLNFEAQRLNSQSHKSDNSSMKDVAKGSVRFDAENNTVRVKPPAPPRKPNFRNSLPENTELQGIHYVNGHQLSKKGIPAFGIPVFSPLTGQVSNEPAPHDGVANGEDTNANREDVNDLAVNSPPVEHNTKSLLNWSVSYQPSESGSRKDGKKAQKEWKKEQKKREEEEKKERKRQEEEKKKEQKKREEEEKRIKKEQKKKQKEAKRTSSRSASLSDSKVSCASPDADLSPYTEVDLAGDRPESSVFTEKIYSEPWGPLPFLSVPPSGDGIEAEYAQPTKIPVHQTASVEPREITHTENYEAIQISEAEYSAPVIIPPKWEETGEDYGTDVYSHLNEGKSTITHENIYGMASASPTVTDFEDENPYEDTTISTYECVG